MASTMAPIRCQKHADGWWFALGPEWEPYCPPQWVRSEKPPWWWAPGATSTYVWNTAMAGSLIGDIPPRWRTVSVSPRPPLPHQETGTQWLLDHPFALLTDEPGLGKTQESINAVQIRRAGGDGGPVLVVTKRSIIPVWLQELRLLDPTTTVSEYRWKNQPTYTPPTDWVLTTYDSLRSDLVQGGWRSVVRQDPRDVRPGSALAYPWHTVILDEVHQIKNPEAGRTVATAWLRPRYGMMLSGTPVVNSFNDLWFALFWSRVFPISPDQFQQAFGMPGATKFDWVFNPEHTALLHKGLAWILFGRKKRDVLTLPPKIITQIPIRLTQAQQRAYNQAKEDWLVWVQQHPQQIFGVLTQLLRLKQVCGGLPLLDPEATAHTHAKWLAFEEQFVPYLKAGAKIVLFTQFRAQWEWLMTHLAPYHPVGIRGGVSTQDRAEATRRFQTDPQCQVFVTTSAGQEGITLTAAPMMVFFDLPWSPAYVEQMIDRIDRIGQTQTINVYFLIAENTVEEKILHVNLAEKAALQQILLHPQSVA